MQPFLDAIDPNVDWCVIARDKPGTGHSGVSNKQQIRPKGVVPQSS